MKYDICCQFLKTFEEASAFSFSANEFIPPHGPCRVCFSTLIVFPCFHVLLQFFFTSVAFCTIFLAFFSLYLQMPLIFTSNTVVSCPLALSWIHFDLTSLSFCSKKFLISVINDLSLTKLQGLFSIPICLIMFALQTNNCSFLTCYFCYVLVILLLPRFYLVCFIFLRMGDPCSFTFYL